MSVADDGSSAGAKAALRARLRRERRLLDPERRDAASRSVQGRVIALPEYRCAGVVCCYLSLPAEVGTGLIIERCRADGKRVCVPAYCIERRRYEPAWLAPETPMVVGSLGVEQPVEPRWVEPEDIDLALVPGVAFDLRGWRVGHGGATDDRLLTLCRDGGRKAADGSRRRPAVVRAGLAFDFQVLDRVPTDPHDVPMDIVVTETRLLRCAREAA